MANASGTTRENNLFIKVTYCHNHFFFSIFVALPSILYQFHLAWCSGGITVLLSDLDIDTAVNFFHNCACIIVSNSCERMVCNWSYWFICAYVCQLYIYLVIIYIRPWSRKLGQLWYEIFRFSCNLSEEQRNKILSDGWDGQVS